MIIYNETKKTLIIPNGLGNFSNNEAAYDEGYTEGKKEGREEGKTTQKAEDEAKLTNLSVTENGTYEADYGYKKVDVNVQGGALEEKNVAIAEDTTEITPSEGYYGIGKANIDASNYGNEKYNKGKEDQLAEDKSQIQPYGSFVENGIYTASDYGLLGFESVEINVQDNLLQEKSVTLEAGVTTTDVRPDDGYNGMSRVIVEAGDAIEAAKESQRIEDENKLEEVTITEGGEYTPNYGYKKVTVNMIPVIESSKSVNITSNGTTTISPTKGYYCKRENYYAKDPGNSSPFLDSTGVGLIYAEWWGNICDGSEWNDAPYELGQWQTYTQNGTTIYTKNTETGFTVAIDGTFTVAEAWSTLVEEVDSFNGMEGAKVTVNVTPNLQALKRYDVPADGNVGEIEADEGYDGMKRFTLNLTNYGIANFQAGMQQAKELITEKTYTLGEDEGTATIEPDFGMWGMSQVNLDATAYGNAKYNSGVTDGKTAQKTEDDGKLTTKEITANGTYTADYGFSSVTVNVDDAPNLQEKSVATAENSKSIEVTPDEGYDGLSKVTVDATNTYNYGKSDGISEQKAADDGKLEETTITANGEYTPSYGYSKVTVNVDSASIVECTQAEYDALTTKDNNTFYAIKG